MTEHTLALVQLEVDVFLAVCRASVYATRSLSLSLSARNQSRAATVKAVVLHTGQGFTVREAPQVILRLKTQSGHQQACFHHHSHEVWSQTFIETHFL